MKTLLQRFAVSIIGFTPLLFGRRKASPRRNPFYDGKKAGFWRAILPNIIPGQPNVIVQNMPGAGGVTGINYLGQVAKPDALTMGYFTAALFHQQVRNPALRTDLSKYSFISGIQGSPWPTFERMCLPASKAPSISLRRDVSEPEA